MKNKGFTLIELLVVVSIIGVLASIVLSSLGEARSKARDARGISEINTLRTALELYNLDNGKYPSGPELYYYAYSDSTTPCGYAVNPSPEGAWCDLENLLAPYIPELPRGSRGKTREYLYKASVGGAYYGLRLDLESNNHPAAVADDGISDSWYEIGEMVSCTNWIAWNGSICTN